VWQGWKQPKDGGYSNLQKLPPELSPGGRSRGENAKANGKNGMDPQSFGGKG
jgi:hypothetical protein